MRPRLRSLAAEGRVVLVSSHLIGEMALTAERLVVIARGRLLAETSGAEVSGRAGPLGGGGVERAGASAGRDVGGRAVGRRGLAGGGVPGAHRRRRGVPRPSGRQPREE